MFYAKKEVEKIDFKLQEEIHNEQIKLFDDLVKGKTPEYIKNDLNTLIVGNEIFFDRSRVFLKYDEKSKHDRAKQRFERMLSAIGKEQIESYCDVGCGHGENPQIALSYGCGNSVGIDITNQWGNNNNPMPGLEYYQVDISKEVFDKRFKLVSSFCAFEHFMDPINMLKRMAGLVENSGYLYIDFSPIWTSSDGHHLYRNIQFPYYHLIFSEHVQNAYNSVFHITNNNLFNKWSVYDFMNLFMSCEGMKMVSFRPYYSTRDYWFARRYSNLLDGYSIEDLIVCGFNVIYKKVE